MLHVRFYRVFRWFFLYKEKVIPPGFIQLDVKNSTRPRSCRTTTFVESLPHLFLSSLYTSVSKRKTVAQGGDSGDFPVFFADLYLLSICLVCMRSIWPHVYCPFANESTVAFFFICKLTYYGYYGALLPIFFSLL